MNRAKINNENQIFSTIDLPFKNCSYLFKKNFSAYKNTLHAMHNNMPVLAFAIEETKKKSDVYISLSKDILCNHYKNYKMTNSSKSSDNTHLTYHGNSINKKNQKLKGELHIKLDNKVVLKDQFNKLEAPISSSDDIGKYPLSLCRIELSDNLNKLKTNNQLNYFDLDHSDLFFNTLDIFVAKKGFFQNMITIPYSCSNFVASYFTNVTLEGCYTDNIIRRRGRYPQVLVLEGSKLEIIIINMIEANNEKYDKSQLFYQHSTNYIKELFDRDLLEAKEGYFIAKDSNTNNHVSAMHCLGN